MSDDTPDQSEQSENSETRDAAETPEAANQAPEQSAKVSPATAQGSARARPRAAARKRATSTPAAAAKGSESASPSLPRTRMAPHIVQCAKLGRRLPGLTKPPIPGELGQRIYENVSEQAWQMWQDHSRLLINHYGLNLADPDARALMRQQMEDFFFGPPEQKPEGWAPEGQGGAKGKDAPAPAASRKK